MTERIPLFDGSVTRPSLRRLLGRRPTRDDLIVLHAFPSSEHGVVVRNEARAYCDAVRLSYESAGLTIHSEIAGGKFEVRCHAGHVFTEKLTTAPGCEACRSASTASMGAPREDRPSVPFVEVVQSFVSASAECGLPESDADLLISMVDGSYVWEFARGNVATMYCANPEMSPRRPWDDGCRSGIRASVDGLARAAMNGSAEVCARAWLQLYTRALGRDLCFRAKAMWPLVRATDVRRSSVDDRIDEVWERARAVAWARHVSRGGDGPSTAESDSRFTFDTLSNPVNKKNFPRLAAQSYRRWLEDDMARGVVVSPDTEDFARLKECEKPLHMYATELWQKPCLFDWHWATTLVIPWEVGALAWLDAEEEGPLGFGRWVASERARARLLLGDMWRIGVSREIQKASAA